RLRPTIASQKIRSVQTSYWGFRHGNNVLCGNLCQGLVSPLVHLTQSMNRASLLAVSQRIEAMQQAVLCEETLAIPSNAGRLCLLLILMTAPALPKRRILVVDDEPFVCEAVKMMLAFDGHSVETACSGKEALALFENDKFDVVITDFAM